MNQNELIYDWIDFMTLQKSHNKPINEATLRNFVSGRNAQLAQAVGALDFEVVDVGGQYGDSIKFGQGDEWVKNNIVTVQLINGSTARFHKNYADTLKKAFDAACLATGWTPQNQGAGYCPKPNGGFVQRRSRAPDQMNKPASQRQIGGHAWGTSIDLGVPASENPMGGGGKIRQFPAFINAMKQGGFVWGGDWPNKDDMHFEINVSGLPPPATGDLENQGYQDDQSSAGEIIADIGTMGRSSKPTAPTTSNIAESIDRKIFSINDESREHLYKKHKKYFDSLLSYLKKELKLTKPVKINLLNDEKNANKVLGRTGSYINHKEEIVIYTTGRHIKDIMRSLSHELVHHRQNIRGEFENHEPTKNGYAQSNKHLRNMEKEAYLKGNMLFRDWEDNYKYRGENNNVH